MAKKSFYSLDFDKNIKDDFIFLGQYTQESDKMIISDPYYKSKYDKKDFYHLNHIIENVKQGSWNTWILRNTGTPAQIVAVYCPHNLTEYPLAADYQFDHATWENIGEICVDTGQAGIYDLKYYRDDCNVDGLNLFHDPQNDGDKWFSANCHVTVNGLCGNIINNGCVANSGWGDGSYAAAILRNNNKVVGAKIVFIDGNDD